MHTQLDCTDEFLNLGHGLGWKVTTVFEFVQMSFLCPWL